MRLELSGAGYTYFFGSSAAGPALQGIDLVLETGELVGVIGPTGSGKSTLAQLLNGLLRPTEGCLIVDGVPLDRPGSALTALRRRVGVVFQFPETQLFEETVERDVAYGARNTGCLEEACRDRVRWALSQVGLSYEDYASLSPFSLSGGEMRRVAIAGVLSMRPQILVLDEPTAGLDPAGRAHLLESLIRLNQAEGVGVVLISHDLEEMAQICRRTVILNKGKVIFDGSTEDAVLREDIIAEGGIELPAPARLLARLRARGWDLPATGISVEECVSALASGLRSRGVLSGAGR